MKTENTNNNTCDSPIEVLNRPASVDWVLDEDPYLQQNGLRRIHNDEDNHDYILLGNSAVARLSTDESFRSFMTEKPVEFLGNLLYAFHTAFHTQNFENHEKSQN